jgi:hypothetical protein
VGQLNGVGWVNTLPVVTLKDFVRPFDVTGKPMKGWFMVASDGWSTDEAINTWLMMGRDFAWTLPEK